MAKEQTELTWAEVQEAQKKRAEEERSEAFENNWVYDPNTNTEDPVGSDTEEHF